MSWRTNVKQEIEAMNRHPITHKITGPIKHQVMAIRDKEPMNYPAVIQPSRYQNNSAEGLISTKQTWPKEMTKKYYMQLNALGFVIGARVKTKYGFTGTIIGFQEPSEMTTFFGHESPSCIYLRKDNVPSVSQNTSVPYNEDELTLIEGEMAC